MAPKCLQLLNFCPLNRYNFLHDISIWRFIRHLIFRIPKIISCFFPIPAPKFAAALIFHILIHSTHSVTKMEMWESFDSLLFLPTYIQFITKFRQFYCHIMPQISLLFTPNSSSRLLQESASIFAFLHSTLHIVARMIFQKHMPNFITLLPKGFNCLYIIIKQITICTDFLGTSPSLCLLSQLNYQQCLPSFFKLPSFGQ